MSNQSVAPVLNTTIQWDGEDRPKPKVIITDAEIYVQSAREKQRYLEKQISDLPIDANWKSGLQHALSKMGMFYSDAYDDLKSDIERIADVIGNSKK